MSITFLRPMGCLLAVRAGTFPRIAFMFMGLAKGFLAAFGGSWIWPLLGLIVRTFTALIWVVLWNPGTAIKGLDWFAVMFDRDDTQRTLRAIVMNRCGVLRRLTSR